MAHWMERGGSIKAKAAADAAVRLTVEAVLADNAQRGDNAVRDQSIRFVEWDRVNYRLFSRLPVRHIREAS